MPGVITSEPLPRFKVKSSTTIESWPRDESHKVLPTKEIHDVTDNAGGVAHCLTFSKTHLEHDQWRKMRDRDLM